MGKQVTGSDIAEDFITQIELEKNGIEPQIDFKPDRVVGTDLVIASGAHGGRTNLEPLHALELGIPVLMHAQALGLFSQGKKVIAVSGCHGKTTTSAMLAWILTQHGMDPSYAIGTSEITGLGAAAHYGQGDYFVIEADEYMTCPHTDRTPRFLYLKPFITIINNIELDHPDRYKDIDDTKQAFRELLLKTDPKGAIIAGIDSQHVQDLLDQNDFETKISTFGYGDKAQFRLDKFKSQEGSVAWDLNLEDEHEKFCLIVPGRHNTLNATAAILAARQIGITPEQSCTHLCGFRGLKRRFELIGVYNNTKVYDDYGHHPTEIASTLRAAREWFPDQKIIIAFQPHTYSRTKALFEEFATAFADADLVLIPEIFASAREEPDPTVNSHQLAAAISQTGQKVIAMENLYDVLDWLRANLKGGDILITMGAGDIYHIAEKLAGDY